MQNLNNRLQVSTCNKCAKEVKLLPALESVYSLNAMHTFNPTFEYCGQDDNVDMQTCEFTMCRTCLLALFNSFQQKVKFEDNIEWSVIE